MRNGGNNPHWPVDAFRETVKTNHTVEVGKSVVYRAKMKAKVVIDGNHKKQYGLIWNYCLEIKRAMPGSTLVVHKGGEEIVGSPGQVFKRFYCFVGPLKEGSLEACRPFIGVDGCFLKGPYGGQLLTAVGIDANNGMHSFAWAVVEKETKALWTWFLRLLNRDSSPYTNVLWTFISDQQKGLKVAMKTVLPHCVHRFCVRHHATTTIISRRSIGGGGGGFEGFILELC
ncbi:hypothetical protein LguiB_016343 [Lonicera macranthoides]